MQRRTSSAMARAVSGIAAFTATLATIGLAHAETYQVGPGKPYATLADVEDLLGPGDLVEVDGDATYPGDVRFRNDATASAPVVIRGVPINGRLPHLQGGAEWTVLFQGNHYVFDGFEVSGGPAYCIVHKADDITIRNTVVHDCPNHGILGTDTESGSLTIENSEVFRCGQGTYKHQIYIATDEGMYPGSVFRLQFSYVHDAIGGNNVKSRSERNELYFNWIEGAFFHNLDLIGSEEYTQDVAREDSDVVGNVIVTTSEWQIARIGGDGTGATNGRYRFANNTFVLDGASDLALRMQYDVESVELFNNVFYRRGGGGGARILHHTDPVGSPIVRGANNWVQDGWQAAPAGLTGTLTGADPGFTDLAGFDLRPGASSPLVNAGSDVTTANDGQAIPSPFTGPMYIPPYRAWLAAGTQVLRPVTGPIDIGAYEEGSPDTGSGGAAGMGGSSGGTGGSSGGTGGSSGGTGGSSGSTGGASGSTGGSSAAGSAGNAPNSNASYWTDDSNDGCACRLSPRPSNAQALATLGVLFGLAARRRRRAHAHSPR